MRKIFLGPPGSGKGTYSSRIAPILDIPHISTGDLFRENLRNETEIGLQAKEYMEQGLLVPDEIVIEMLKKRIEKDDCAEGFILDGFPRTVPQAEALKDLIDVDVVSNLVVPEDILIEKACARRICKECGDIYNVADINRSGVVMPPMNPKFKGKCDKCQGELIQREDDNEKTVKSRLDVYKKETQPLIDFYKNLGILKDIRVVASPEKMVPKILRELIKNR
jgi:adenylate kinase